MNNFSFGSEAIQKQFDWAETPPSTAIIEGIATLENTEPTALADQFNPLFEYIDPEALNMIATAEAPTTISFSIEQYTVEISGSSLNIWID